MKNPLKLLAATVLATAYLSPAAWAASADHGTDAQAQEMVGKAVALIQSVGPEKAYTIFTNHPDNQFKDRDLYVFVYDFDGVCLAQGANPKMVGKHLLEMKDVDGVAFIKGEIEMVKKQKKGWFGPYRFNNVATQTIEVKKSYCEQGAGNTIVCVGTHTSK